MFEEAWKFTGIHVAARHEFPRAQLRSVAARARQKESRIEANLVRETHYGIDHTRTRHVFHRLTTLYCSYVLLQQIGSHVNHLGWVKWCLAKQNTLLFTYKLTCMPDSFSGRHWGSCSSGHCGTEKGYCIVLILTLSRVSSQILTAAGAATHSRPDEQSQERGTLLFLTS